MGDALCPTDDSFWPRLVDHKRDQTREYVGMLLRDPETICQAFNASRREEFMRLLVKGLGMEDSER